MGGFRDEEDMKLLPMASPLHGLVLESNVEGTDEGKADDRSLCSPLLLEMSQRAQVSQNSNQTNTGGESRTGRNF